MTFIESVDDAINSFIVGCILTDDLKLYLKATGPFQIDYQTVHQFEISINFDSISYVNAGNAYRLFKITIHSNEKIEVDRLVGINDNLDKTYDKYYPSSSSDLIIFLYEKYRETIENRHKRLRGRLK